MNSNYKVPCILFMTLQIVSFSLAVTFSSIAGIMVMFPFFYNGVIWLGYSFEWVSTIFLLLGIIVHAIYTNFKSNAKINSGLFITGIALAGLFWIIRIFTSFSLFAWQSDQLFIFISCVGVFLIFLNVNKTRNLALSIVILSLMFVSVILFYIYAYASTWLMYVLGYRIAYALTATSFVLFTYYVICTTCPLIAGLKITFITLSSIFLPSLIVALVFSHSYSFNTGLPDPYDSNFFFLCSSFIWIACFLGLCSCFKKHNHNASLEPKPSVSSVNENNTFVDELQHKLDKLQSLYTKKQIDNNEYKSLRKKILEEHIN